MSEFEISLLCSSVISYYQVQNGISPVKRLYVRNASDFDCENIEISVSSKPDFLLPVSEIQAVFPARANLRFDGIAKLSPLYMVAQNRKHDGEITVQVLKDGVVLEEATERVTVLAFDECNVDKPESIATFVRRTPDVNRLLNLAHKKIAEWGFKDVTGTGYANASKNKVRNLCAATYAVLCDYGFLMGKKTTADSVIVSDFSEILSDKVATPMELALIFASVIESAGYNPVVAKSDNSWYVACFLTEECMAEDVFDDMSYVAKKAAAGVGEATLIDISGIFKGESFEKCEKNAVSFLKKSPTVDFAVDIKRARIMGILPQSVRVKTEGGYDLVESDDYKQAAPPKIKEYGENIGGESLFTREKQWERRLLELDLRNSLLNFRVSNTAVKILTASIETFVENVTHDKPYTLTAHPKDVPDGDARLNPSFDNPAPLKPLSEYLLYEYKNKRLSTVFSEKEQNKTLLNLYRKEKTIEEESGTASLYVACGFLKWRESENEKFKYAPLILYPVSIDKKGISLPVFSITFDVDGAQINNTLLEFLYQEFRLDMRGLSAVELSDAKSILAVIARVKKEIADKPGWEIIDNVYLNVLSFTNYLMWHDVRYNIDKFKESPLIRSMISNSVDAGLKNKTPTDTANSDEAYFGTDRMLLPISADSSQYQAIKASLNGSFVLHGPPGTGKSQTITNIIVNNIVRGRRVLFVAEKMAALNVVYKRLVDCGAGDFCLELHSDKTHKTDILSKIINTLNLGSVASDVDFEEKANEIKECIDKLQGEIDAMHRKRYLGFSLYEAMMAYLDNSDAPDCLRIDGLFYEKLTASSFNRYLDILTELAIRAKECGDIEKSPFRYIGKFDYTDAWREEAESVLDIYQMELRHLKTYARELQTLINMRTISLTGEKLKALYFLSDKLTSDEKIAKYFENACAVENAKGLVESYLEAARRDGLITKEYENKYGKYPENVAPAEVKEAMQKSSFLPKSVKKALSSVDKNDRREFLEFLLIIAETKETVKKRRAEVASLFATTENDMGLDDKIATVSALYDAARALYADCDFNLFNETCRRLTKNKPHVLMEYYMRAYETEQKAKTAFENLFCIVKKDPREEINSTIDRISSIEKNMDYIPSWCRYQSVVERCGQEGFDFVLEPLFNGEITAEDVLRSFKKCVYFNFVRSELYLDDVLCRFSGLSLEETMQRFRALSDEYEKLTRSELYLRLVSKLPRTDTSGEHNLERVLLYRAEKTNMQGTTIRALFSQIPEILRATCPCLLMSPVSVAQYLDIEKEKFDLVVFDEASQMPTCEAVGAIARGKNVIVVGDPKQLPPTMFFRTDYRDEQHFEVEDLESVLDDCLAIGMPERHLLWHYRSNHESLIAFSNSMFYDNKLLTFPSPNELKGKVKLAYVDGVYERGGSKCNKKEGDALVKEVVARLKNPQERNRSIGIVTFNTAQQNYIEDKLQHEIHKEGLDDVAYDVDEPVFVKNLENVQGDERDLILFSVGYGPDATGRLSLNFGPINQQGGYKRLNVAVTRARSEMIVFSSVTGNMIDLNRTDSVGVKALKAFLEYAERGPEMLSIAAKDVRVESKGIGENVAKDLKDRGLLCDANVGVSDFKIDVAVVDPRDKNKYILAIIADSEHSAKIPSAKDRMTMQTRILKKLGWNVYNLWTINYFNNQKREINKIKEVVATLTEKKVVSKKTVRDALQKYRKTYKAAYIKPLARAGAEYVLNFVNEEAIMNKIRTVIEVESPIEESCLIDKIAAAFCVPKTAKKAIAQISRYVSSYEAQRQEYFGKVFYVDKPVTAFRPSDARVTRDLTKVHPDEIVAAAKCAIEATVYIEKDDLNKEVFKLFNVAKRTKSAVEWVDAALSAAVQTGEIIVTPDGFCRI